MNPSAGAAAWQNAARSGPGAGCDGLSRCASAAACSPPVSRGILFPLVRARRSAPGEPADRSCATRTTTAEQPRAEARSTSGGSWRCGVVAGEPGRDAAAAAARAPWRCALCEARAEMPRPGLLGHEGSSWDDCGRRCLMLAGQQGVALAAPPRAGKGTGVVVPNALNWPGSLVCVDIKTRELDADRRLPGALGPGLLPLRSLRRGRTYRALESLLLCLPRPARRLNDLQRIAEMLYPDPPERRIPSGRPRPAPCS